MQETAKETTQARISATSKSNTGYTHRYETVSVNHYKQYYLFFSKSGAGAK
jgi:hypothetical protein